MKNNESPELQDLRKKLSDVQDQLDIALKKSQIADEDATEKAEQVIFIHLQVNSYDHNIYISVAASVQGRPPSPF